MAPKLFSVHGFKPLAILAIPGSYMAWKLSEFKRLQRENRKKKVAQKELCRLKKKINKLLLRLDEYGQESASTDEEECVVCYAAKATIQTDPCGHRVLCRKCFVRTIQVALTERCLPLCCVMCRARITMLKQSVLVPAQLCEESPQLCGGSPHLCRGEDLDEGGLKGPFQDTPKLVVEGSGKKKSGKISKRMDTIWRTNKDIQITDRNFRNSSAVTTTNRP